MALVAASLDEARRVMVEGPSGILAIARPGEVREWSFQRRRILFATGAEACLFSGAHPDGLRGPEHDFAWCDELAKWRHPQEAWDNLQLGLRRGARPRALVTTTPRRGAALTELLVDVHVYRAYIRPGEIPEPALEQPLLDAIERARATRPDLEGELVDVIGWRLDDVVPAAEIVDRISAEFPLEPVEPGYRGEVAKRWRYRDGAGEIGLIASVTQPFCGDCTRSRISAEGRLYTCLFAVRGHDLRALVRGGATDEQLRDAITTIWGTRTDRYSERRSEATVGLPKVEMSYIGG